MPDIRTIEPVEVTRSCTPRPVDSPRTTIHQTHFQLPRSGVLEDRLRSLFCILAERRALNNFDDLALAPEIAQEKMTDGTYTGHFPRGDKDTSRKKTTESWPWFCSPM